MCAQIGSELLDLSSPIDSSCNLTLHTFDSAEGRDTFFHSAAHVLGAVLEQAYEAKLGHGPSVESGFFYDADMSD